LGIIFFGHGAQKMLGWYGGPGLTGSMRTFTEHLHLPSTLAFLVIAGEFFGGIGLIVGLFSRIAALFIVLTMVGAIATVHFRFGLFLNWFGSQEGHGIEYHLLAIALALVVVVKGAPAFSLDRLVHEHVSGWGQSIAGNKTMTAVGQVTVNCRALETVKLFTLVPNPCEGTCGGWQAQSADSQHRYMIDLLLLDSRLAGVADGGVGGTFQPSTDR
jgi:putative oxidoreductase